MAKKTISELNIKITSDAKGVKKGVDGAKRGMASLKTAGKGAFKGMAISVAIFAAAIAAAVIVAKKLFNQLVDSAAQFDTIVKSARALRVEVDKLQAVQLLAEFSGGDAEQITVSLERMQIAIGDAATGTGRAADAFKALGLNVDALNLTDPITALEQMARALQSVDTRAEQLDLLSAIVGKRQAGSVINTLDAMAGGLGKLDDLIRDLGLSLTEIQSSEIEEMNDALATAKAASTGFWRQLTAELAPAITEAALVAADFVVALQEWVPVIAETILQLIELTKALSPLFQAVKFISEKMGLLGDDIFSSFKLARDPLIALAVDAEFLADALDDIAEANKLLQLGAIGAVDIRTQTGLSAARAGDREVKRAAIENRKALALDEKRNRLLDEMLRAAARRSADNLTVVPTTIVG